MRVVIIGGGSAGISAATHLRRQDENVEIIILEKSNEFAISSCGLPYLIDGKIKDKDEIIGASVEQMRNLFKIDVRLNTEVLSIKQDKKLLKLSPNGKLIYDYLILATGAIQLRPDISGVLSENIFTLNNLYSTQRIINYFYKLDAKNVIVLGGGFIGIRVAEALLNNGAKVTLIEKSNQILNEFDYDFAQMIKHKLKAKGLDILTSTIIKEFQEDKIILSNSEKLKYDMAIISVGTTNELKLPIMTNIDIGMTGGIAVDQHMKTSVDGIWACGENLELTDLVSELPIRPKNASLIVRSAKVAADNVLGIQSSMSKVLRNQIVKAFDYVFGVTGCNEDELNRAGIPYYKLYFSQLNAETYIDTSKNINCKLLFGLDGKILGFQIFGNIGVNSRLNIVAAMIQQNANVQHLAEFTNAYFPEFSRAKDILNNMGTLAIEMTFERMKTITLEDLKENDVLLNVCKPDKFKHFTKAKAINIPLSSLRDNLTSLPLNKKIVVTCGNGYAAYMAYCILKQRGFDKVFLLNSPETWQ